MSSENWIDFWNTQTVMDDGSWLKNMQLMVDGCQSFFPFESNDAVLDIGSGPGFLANLVHNKVQKIVCLDTSQRYINDGNKRFAEANHVNFFQLNQDYLDFSMLDDNKFTKILCASVIQYYKSIDEVKKLIEEMKQRALPGAKMLIADISITHHALKDLLGLVETAWKKKYLLQVVGFVFKSLFGDYARIRKSQGLLTIQKKDLDNIINELNLKAEWKDDILTLNKTRRHLLIHF